MGTRKARKSRTPRAGGKPTRKWVYLFAEGSARRKDLLGGKGANLAEMTRLGLPVPPGFIVTTSACNAYLAAGGFPQGMWKQVERALAKVERLAGKRFGDAPIRCWSPAAPAPRFSMPGMMDTVLNIGLNDEVADGLAKLTGDERFVYDAYRRLVQMFGTVVMGLPDEPFEAVLARQRAAARRRERRRSRRRDDLRDDHGASSRRIVKKQTRAPFPTIRASSCAWPPRRSSAPGTASAPSTTATPRASPTTWARRSTSRRWCSATWARTPAPASLTTRNVTTGENELEGDYLINAQGEDVVAGTRATRPHRGAEEGDADASTPSSRATAARSRSTTARCRTSSSPSSAASCGCCRRATPSARRRPRCASRSTSHAKASSRAPRPSSASRPTTSTPSCTRSSTRRRRPPPGNAATCSPPASTSRRARQAACSPSTPTPPSAGRAKEKKAVIMVRPETKPDDVHGMLAAKGILTSRGGRTSHAALVARQFGKPAVVGVSAMEVDLERRAVHDRGPRSCARAMRSRSTARRARSSPAS